MISLFFDTETTALIANSARSIDKQPRVVELFATVREFDGREREQIDVLINPGVPLSDETQKITGITQDMVDGKLPFRVYASAFVEMVETVDQVVAHNLAYDKQVIDFELKRLGMTVRWPRLLCTVEATEHLKGYRLSLSDLHEFLFGEKFEGAHRARQDVEALANCYYKLYCMGEI